METMNRNEATASIISSEDILKKMRMGIKETYEISLRSFKVPVRVLSMDELVAVRREGIKHQALIGGDETDRNCYIEKTVLKLASTLTKNGAPLLMDGVLDKMTLEEISHLYGEYVKIMDDCSPELEQIPIEQFRALIDAVKKNSVTAKDCSLRQLRAIFYAYQDLIQKQETQILPPDNTHGG